MTIHFDLRMLCCGTLVVLLPPIGTLRAADPLQITLESIRECDAEKVPRYTLQVTIEEPAHAIFRDQGTSIKSCTMTQGPAGFAAVCNADQLPKPVYHPPGTYEGPDYDDQGRLGVGMRAKVVTFRTKETNETYDEVRVLYVSPQGKVVDAGVSRTLERYPPDDRGICSWTYNHLHRVWWALGHGLSRHLIEFQGDVVKSGQRNVFRVRGGLSDERPVGVWKLSVEASPTRLVREATFLRNLDGLPMVEVTTKGERQLDGMTFAEEGSLRTSNGIETRVILIDFNARFDEEFFLNTRRSLENLEEGEIQLFDYRADPRKPSWTRMEIPSRATTDEK